MIRRLDDDLVSADPGTIASNMPTPSRVENILDAQTGNLFGRARTCQPGVFRGEPFERIAPFVGSPTPPGRHKDTRPACLTVAGRPFAQAESCALAQ